jgi:hypothetical protein
MRSGLANDWVDSKLPHGNNSLEHNGWSHEPRDISAGSPFGKLADRQVGSSEYSKAGSKMYSRRRK